MEDNVISFSVGFKSYDITREESHTETRYNWTERDHNMIRRTFFSQKTMEWLCFALKETSKVKREFCKKMEAPRILLCVLLLKKFQQTWTLHKYSKNIAKFINGTAIKPFTIPSRNIEEGLLCSEIAKRNKWTTREMEKATVQERSGILCISEGVSFSQNELISRSVVGSLPGGIADTPTLSDIRRWVNSTWKHVHRVNIYEMGQNRFLFEFPSKTTVEYILRGNWSWKLHRLRLQWWSPTVESIPCSAAIEQVWIRLVGLPLHLWSQNVFKEIGDYCGGWIRTEEETQLRNHLKWERFLVRGNGDNSEDYQY
ncbi:hypothetical protein FXO37_22872 [Capsicum annuum]|nr:hypothetical protein FXO37_22872 [Capsicum annuum]